MARLAHAVAHGDRGLVRLVARVQACQGCGACLLTCPEHAIRPRRDEGATTRPAALDVRQDRCTGCGECVEVCPVDAIELVPVDHGTTHRPVPHRPEEVQTG